MPLTRNSRTFLSVGVHDAQRLWNVLVNCAVDDIVVDEGRKIVTTPAYMLAERIRDAAQGINKLVAKVLQLAA